MANTMAGKKTRSPIKAANDAEEISSPREKTWLNEEKSKAKEARKSTAVVEIRALEVT